jgi:polysaccharide export outer membrane protein
MKKQMLPLRAKPLRCGSVLALALFWLTVSFAVAQTTGTQTGTTGKTDTTSAGAGLPTLGALVASDEDYRIGINDVIEVQIEDAAELSGSYRVTKAGDFYMNFLGRVIARNKTVEELSKLITEGLRERYLTDPHVKVFVKQYNSRSFFIQGSVRSPGVYQVEGKPSLLVLLTLAGGLAENHGSTAFVLRPNKQTPTASRARQATEPAAPETAEAAPAPTAQAAVAQNEYSLLKVNISGLLLGRFDQNMYLEPGDIVNIPPSDVFFVAGEVAKPGSFNLKFGTTLRQAISLAQGPNFKADMGHGVIFRDDVATGKKKEIKVDIAAVMKGKSEDVEILANDIIIVPNSRLKTVTAPLLSAFGMSAVRMPMVY